MSSGSLEMTSTTREGGSGPRLGIRRSVEKKLLKRMLKLMLLTLQVGAWGWVEEPYNSPEENCLAWSVLATSSFSSSSFWHGSSCCNNLLYICQLI